MRPVFGSISGVRPYQAFRVRERPGWYTAIVQQFADDVGK